MVSKHYFGAIVLSLGVSLLTSQAQAIAVSDVTLQNSIGGYDNASAAAAGMKKPKKTKIAALEGLFAGDQWSVLDRTNKASKTFNGVDFTLTADAKQRSGEWGLSWGDSDLAQYMDFVVILKGGKQWSAYLFESGSIGVDSMSANGTFDMPLIKKKNGKTAKLRRATILGRLADLPIDIDILPPNTGDGSQGSGGGSQGSSSSSQGSGDGSQGSGDGSQGSGDGSQGSGDGSQGSGDGSQGSGDGSQGSGSGSTTVQVGGSQTPNLIPIPGSLALLTLGLALCGRQVRRRSVK